MAVYVDTGENIAHIFPQSGVEEYVKEYGEVLLLALSSQEMDYLSILAAQRKIPRDVTRDCTFERDVLHLLLLPQPLGLHIIRTLAQVGVSCAQIEKNFECSQMGGDLNIVSHQPPI